MKIGVIFCCYGNPEYVEPCLAPWIKLKEKYNIKIAAVHGQFKEYHDMGAEDRDIDTAMKLAKLWQDNHINHLYIQNNYDRYAPKDKKIEYQTEAEIRNYGLQYLLDGKCDIIWLLDNDEFYTEGQIENIIKYINKEDNQFYTYFKIRFKNYFGDGKQYLDDFCPSRIWKVKTEMGYQLFSCHWDNDFTYCRVDNYKDATMYYPDMKDSRFASKEIPKNICFCKHLTWLDNERSHQKILYQEKHFSMGAGCGYKWENGHLQISEEYYKKTGQQLPIIYKDE